MKIMKLSLNKETLRTLSPSDASEVAGGREVTTKSGSRGDTLCICHPDSIACPSWEVACTINTACY